MFVNLKKIDIQGVFILIITLGYIVFMSFVIWEVFSRAEKRQIYCEKIAIIHNMTVEECKSIH